MADDERYRRISSLGHGAMGEVWLAEDVVLGRQVAVKQLRVDPSRGVDAEAVERMMREARTAARLHHRNIVSVFDLQTVDGQPNVVMEYVDGESLAERIKRTGPLPIAEVARLGAQIASGLELAHRRDIVHRDVKPANIMIETDGEAKLADFGIARGLHDAALTDTGNMIGTIAFMAPEVARTGKASEASDVWSLGATLYAAIEGRAPFDDDSKPNTTQLLIKLITEPAPASERAGELAPLLARMLDAEPETRPNAIEVARALDSSLLSAPTEEACRMDATARSVITDPAGGSSPDVRTSEPVEADPIELTNRRLSPSDQSRSRLTPERSTDQLDDSTRIRPNHELLPPSILRPRRHRRIAWAIASVVLFCAAGLTLLATQKSNRYSSVISQPSPAIVSTSGIPGRNADQSQSSCIQPRLPKSPLPLTVALGVGRSFVADVNCGNSSAAYNLIDDDEKGDNGDDQATSQVIWLGMD